MAEDEIKEVKRYRFAGKDYETFGEAKAALKLADAREALQQLFEPYSYDNEIVDAILEQRKRLHAILWRLMQEETT